MKIFQTIIISLLLGLTSCKSDSNSTDCGDFWHSEFKPEKFGHDAAIWEEYIQTIQVDNKFCVHLIKYLPFDDESYYVGSAFVKNDTMHFDIQEKLTFSFKKTREMTYGLKLCNLYFTSKTTPKVICWGNNPKTKKGPSFIDVD